MSFMTSRHTEPLRYYVYVSDNKLDMLFEQIDQNRGNALVQNLRLTLKLLALHCASLTIRLLREPPSCGWSRDLSIHTIMWATPRSQGENISAVK